MHNTFKHFSASAPQYGNTEYRGIFYGTYRGAKPMEPPISTSVGHWKLFLSCHPLSVNVAQFTGDEMYHVCQLVIVNMLVFRGVYPPPNTLEQVFPLPSPSPSNQSIGLLKNGSQVAK